MRLVACVTVCLMPTLANAAQPGPQAPSDHQAYCVNRKASPARAAISLDRENAEN